MKMRTMKTWKRILSGVLAVMLMSTAGCGSSDGNVTSATGDNASEAKAETTTEAGGGYGDGLVYLNQVFEAENIPADSAKKDLVIAQSKDPGSLLPYNVSPSIYATSGWMICERLAAFDENMDVIPVLLDEYKYSDDGLTLTFTLKKGVKYSTGEEMVAADVVGVIQNYVASSSLASGRKDLF